VREEGAEGEEGGFKSVRDTVYESYVRALNMSRVMLCFHSVHYVSNAIILV